MNDIKTTLVEPDPTSISLIRKHFSSCQNLALHTVAIGEKVAQLNSLNGVHQPLSAAFNLHQRLLMMIISPIKKMNLPLRQKPLIKLMMAALTF